MLRARSFLIDREAVACDGDGLPVFDRLRYRRQDRAGVYGFNLLELNGQDMRSKPLEVRKRALAAVLLRKVDRRNDLPPPPGRKYRRATTRWPRHDSEKAAGAFCGRFR